MSPIARSNKHTIFLKYNFKDGFGGNQMKISNLSTEYRWGEIVMVLSASLNIFLLETKIQ